MKRAIAVAATLLCVALILGAVYVDDRREPTIDPTLPVWAADQMITVSWPRTPFFDAAPVAVQALNRQIGCRQPVLVGVNGEADITLRPMDSSACDGHAKPLQKQHNEGVWWCLTGLVEVQFRDMADPRWRYPYVIHGLGHALGLAHDYSGSSVMRDPPPPLDPGKPAPELTAKDRKALKARLCPGG